jgi:micrococcal nuclease
MPIIFEDYRRKRRARRAWRVLGGLGIAAASAMVALAYQNQTPASASPLMPNAASSVATPNAEPAYRKVRPRIAERTSQASRDECTVVDGDTLRCGNERVRLIGIDAPELPGHCRSGRSCVAGDPFAATEALRQRIENSEVKIERVGVDRYGRTLATIYAEGRNVACDLISQGHAQYVQRWDDGGRVAADCNVTL